MKKGKVISPAEVDFWLDADKYSNFFEASDPSNDALVFSVDMVRLSSIRKAIANFVRILTRRNIPVYFNDADANVNFGGKVIYISAQLNTKADFDVAVGQALHEGAHTLKTDFDVVKAAWANIPSPILKLSDAKNIRRASLEKFIHTMWNVIEDRYIDDYVFNEAPGYRGYYVALYDRFWHNPEIDWMLRDPDLFRYPSLDSYDFRITNFTNLNTDLLALPRLEDIAKVIDISHISRLRGTKSRVETAFKVTEIVLDCLDKMPKMQTIAVPGGQKLAKASDYFDFGDETEPEEGPAKSGGASDGQETELDKEPEGKDAGTKAIEEISDVLSGKDATPEKLKENETAVNKIAPSGEVEKSLKKHIKEVTEAQRQFLRGEIPKDQLTSKQKSLLDLVEKHGIEIVQVTVPTVLSGDDHNLKVDCIVVQKMTKELVLSGESVFPLSDCMKIGDEMPKPPEEVAEAVKKGIQLGTKLGRKLQIRAEVNPIKTVRKKVGKINRRQLHEASFDAEDLFYKVKIDEHHKANLHITVDSSGSMSGEKWERTMTAVVAICKAASMIDNVHVTVSFRSTQDSGSASLPYIVMAYDSNVDKFSKVRTLFPYLRPNGLTPEGLAFGATMNLFEGITPDEEDRFFLNLSDGEPYYCLGVPGGATVSYTNEVGATHTKSQVDKIRRHGVEILSYFIDDGHENAPFTLKKSSEMTPDELEQEKRRLKRIEDNPKRKIFRKMYGKNAQFIDVESIVDLARTINGLFLRGNEKKS